MKSKILNLGHIRLISRYWTRYSVRSGAGLVYLLIALVFGLSATQIMVAPVEQLIAQQKKATGNTDPVILNKTIVAIGKPVLRFVLGTESLGEIAAGEQSGRGYPNAAHAEGGPANRGTDVTPWVHFLLEERPALLSAIFLVLVFGMPFSITFLAFNQVTGDIQTYGLRYLLLRTNRNSIYFGRFLGTVVFSTLVIAIMVATITLYLGAKLRIYAAADLAGWAVCGFLALSILMIPYIALGSLVSASVDSPFLSLVLLNAIIGGALILPALGGLAWEPAKHFNYVLPWAWQNNLLHPDPAHWIGAALACLAYAAVFLMLGYYRFVKRDL